MYTLPLLILVWTWTVPMIQLRRAFVVFFFSFSNLQFSQLFENFSSCGFWHSKIHEILFRSGSTLNPPSQLLRRLALGLSPLGRCSRLAMFSFSSLLFTVASLGYCQLGQSHLPCLPAHAHAHQKQTRSANFVEIHGSP
jgi:hypothetical protein